MTSTGREAIQIGSYQLGERVGEGGTAEVYAALDSAGHEVAIKLLGPHAELDDPNGRARFARETELLRETRHPNLVQLIDAGIDPELGPYLVTELVRGSSLREHIGVGPDIAALLCVDIVSAVAALHRIGLVHRDLKPENVLLAADGRAVLIDLGLAMRPGQTRFTEEGEVTGSVPYMSPEQIEGTGIAPASDSWALGVLLYEVACGRRPFSRERPSEEAAAILVGACRRLEEVDERAAPELADAIHRCLSRDPAARPTAEQLLAVVQATLPDVADIDLGRYIADVDGLVGQIADRRVAELSRRAAATAAPFEATRLLSRALSYRPEDASVRAALASVQQRVGREPSARAAPPRSHRRLWIALGGVALAGATTAAIVLALGSGPERDDSSVPVAATADVESEPAQREPDVLDHVADSLLGNIPENSRSDRAAKRVAGGFLELLGRSAGAERDADGKLVARQGRAGEKSNEELTLDVFGGILDLVEDGMAAKKGAKLPGANRVSLPAPRALSNDDKARDPKYDRRQMGERLLVMAGRTDKQLRAVRAEVERSLRDSPSNIELHVVLAIYQFALGDDKAGFASLSFARRNSADGSETRALANLVRGRVELRRGKLAQAMKYTERALAITADDASALAQRGRLHFLAGRTKSAYVDLSRALSLEPHNVRALQHMAELYVATDGEASAKPIISVLAQLRLDDNKGAKAIDSLERLCSRGAKSACAR